MIPGSGYPSPIDADGHLMSPDPTPERLRTSAESLTHRLLQLAERRFRCSLPAVEIRFDLRGQAAGMVRHRPGQPSQIRYNQQLLTENGDRFLNRTVPHEVAHLAVHAMFRGAAKPHGREWKAVMEFFGADPVRCHDFDVSASRTRRLRRFSYRCGCREHQLSSIRHKRVRAGQVYICRACNQPLQPDISRNEEKKKARRSGPC